MFLDYHWQATILQGVRNLLQGRVLLSDNYVADDYDTHGLTVTVQGSSPMGRHTIPGGQLFAGNGYSAVLVQPGASNTPGDIEYQETVTLAGVDDEDDEGAAFVGGNLVLAEAATHDYTVGRGAYIRLPDNLIPDVCRAHATPDDRRIRFITNNFIPVLNMSPLDEWFPGVLVSCRGVNIDHTLTMGGYWFNFALSVFNCDVFHPEEDISERLIADSESLQGMVLEDNYLGGTVDESHPVSLIPWYSSEQSMRGQRFFTAQHGLEVGWVEARYQAKTYEIWQKT